MENIVYWLLVSSFISHEIDAALRHEWRILPILRILPERVGEIVFIWGHIPLIAIIFIFSAESEDNIFRIVLACFSVVHVGLHRVYMKHSAYEFNNYSSISLIYVTAFLGLLYLFLIFY